MKLLIAEDTVDLNRAVSAVLLSQNYEVDSVYDGEEAMEHIRQQSYDGIILDIMMPKKDGLEVLRELRESGLVTPVLLLTAKTEIDDRVAGLDAGADDYLPKPFAMKELLARIRSMTRRRSEYGDRDLAFGDFVLSATSFELSAENSVSLSIKEYELMQTFIRHQGKELSTEYLLEHVWKEEPDAQSDTVWLYVSYLKAKLASVASSAFIEGKRGGSYCLLAG
ncbi:MAG: response regulator transcription factor [Eubacteriales bacterium]|nr:response regulator transcription factor [Eubacteriales bacterium]